MIACVQFGISAKPKKISFIYTSKCTMYTYLFIYFFLVFSYQSTFVHRKNVQYLKCGNVDQHITQNNKLLIYFTLPWLLYLIGSMKTSLNSSRKTSSQFIYSYQRSRISPCQQNINNQIYMTAVTRKSNFHRFIFLSTWISQLFLNANIQRHSRYYGF